MQKTIGGERLGAGKKIQVDLHNWGRSTFDQNTIWRSTVAPGVLTPCYVNVGLNGTTFDIDINALGHTLPTIAPLFGSFKLQVDLFACPVRLYQGLLHNNALNIGLDMKSVLFPTISIPLNGERGAEKTSTSSLLNYLGIRGATPQKQEFNAIPILAYYDIYKNYYINKQEENAKVIGTKKEDSELDATLTAIYKPQDIDIRNFSLTFEKTNYNTWEVINPRDFDDASGILTLTFNKKLGEIENLELVVLGTDNELYYYHADEILTENYIALIDENSGLSMIARLISNDKIEILNRSATGQLLKVTLNNLMPKIDIIDFPTENLDKARRVILQNTDFNYKVTINEDIDFLPYSTNIINDEHLKLSQRELNGLCLKTYQNDIYNTWLSTEYIDNINRISSITPIDGEITIDAIILAKKVYNVLNRIAVSGGTYEDWQESVYGQQVITRAESPIYIGGMSSEITFEEVVSTSATNINNVNQPLATLGGKSNMVGKKGGNIIYKCDEPCFIIGIASITPRVDYHQGNKWFMTDIYNMENFHKPEYDGIGFQNLIANNVVWSESPDNALAKQTAWINYQTAVNEVYGDFAKDIEGEENSLYFMTLRRNYEVDSNGEIQDFTSYIDPAKYNYPFANPELTAQNFWIQLGFNVKTRRVMASYEIPNL